MKVSAIVPAAGYSRRMGQGIDKPFIEIRQKEIIAYALEALEKSAFIYEVILASSIKNINLFKKLIEKNSFKKIKCVVKGGAARSVSVFNSLSKISEECDFVLIHDAVRPFLSERLINSVVIGALDTGAAISAVPVKPTIKKVVSESLLVQSTLDRNVLWEAQTPQVFKKDILLAAFKKIGKKTDFTDEAGLVEAIGGKVKVIYGDYLNIKITTPEDLVIAEAIVDKL